MFTFKAGRTEQLKIHGNHKIILIKILGQSFQRRGLPILPAPVYDEIFSLVRNPRFDPAQ